MNDNTVTNDMSKFGDRELAMASELLEALGQGRKNDASFLSVGVAVWFNTSSGNVFLCDEDYNVAMMDGDTLRDFLSSPYEGREGFPAELAEQYPEMHPDDQEWFRYMAQLLDIELPELEA